MTDFINMISVHSKFQTKIVKCSIEGKLTWCLLGSRTVEASNEPEGFHAKACSSLEKDVKLISLREGFKAIT